MALSILDAIKRYRQIHADFSDGSLSESEAKVKLDQLGQDCKSSGVVFSPKADDLYQHEKFEVEKIEDESSEEASYEEPSEESSD